MEQHRLYSVTEVQRLRQQVSDLLDAITKARRPAPKDETGWLIEWPPSPDSQPRWWSPIHGWTIDSLRAIRYGRKEDAEAAIKTGVFVGGVIATEHMWVAPSVTASA